MVIPYTTYQVLKPIPARVSMPQTGTELCVSLPQGTTFRISLWTNPAEDEVQILLADESAAALKELQDLLKTGEAPLCIRISKDAPEQSCYMSSDFSQAVYFYTVQDEYGAFSNFSPHGFKYEGQYFATVEHYYQSKKFKDEIYKQRIIRAATPKDAADLGKTKSIAIRGDWEQVKIEVMRQALSLKFAAHAELCSLLLSTGDKLLIENSPYDNYWGIGRTGTGLNHLGTLLMQVRSMLAHKL